MCGMPHESRYIVAPDLTLEFLTGDEVSGRHSDGDLSDDFKMGCHAFPIKIRLGAVVQFVFRCSINYHIQIYATSKIEYRL